jgi:hypothetical protein
MLQCLRGSDVDRENPKILVKDTSGLVSYHVSVLLPSAVWSEETLT